VVSTTGGRHDTEGASRAVAYHDDRGAALVASLWIALLVGALAIGAWTVADARLSAARGRADAARAEAFARAAVQAAAAWFEDEERSGLVPPPRRDDVLRDLRAIDPDGDGEGRRWSAERSPWDVRYKEGAGADDLFRPPDGPSPRDRFVGTADRPDVLLEADGAGAFVLRRLAAALGVPAEARVERIAAFGPARGGRPDGLLGRAELATIEAVVSWPTSGGMRTRAAARGEVVRVPWGRLDRPLEVAGDARFLGAARWARGEALVAGDLFAPAATWGGWPGGVPWRAVDAPLHDDENGDGLDDDADGDGAADLDAFRGAPGTVPDPWWRGRVGGRWHGAPEVAGTCLAPLPFGPRATPPAPPAKQTDRSGLFVACPQPAPAPLDPAWEELARLGRRGAGVVEEDARAPGAFRLDGAGRALALDALPDDALWWVVPSVSRLSALVLPGDGRRGAWCVAAGDAALALGRGVPRPLAAPGDPRDTRGESRPGEAGDDHLPLTREPDGWQPGRWKEPSGLPAPERWYPEPAESVAFEGLVAAAGQLGLEGPGLLLGQARAGDLRLDGTAGPTEVRAARFVRDDPRTRPGPPGSPRIVVRGLRLVAEP
jgi:hypothetical protein